MNKILQEVYEILGAKPAEQPKIDPTQPHDVAGGFVVHGVTSLDEEILENISKLTWEQIGDIGLLGTVEHSDFQILTMAFQEGIPAFRETWNSLVEDGYLGKYLNRGAFVTIAKMCRQTESYSRYIYWCLNMLREANEATKRELIEKKREIGMIFPTGQSKDQHEKNTERAMPYLGKDRIEPYEQPDGEEYREKKLKDVKDAESNMAKLAAKSGKMPDEAWPNLWIDLARERARNS